MSNLRSYLHSKINFGDDVYGVFIHADLTLAFLKKRNSCSLFAGQICQEKILGCSIAKFLFDRFNNRCITVVAELTQVIP